MCKDQLMSTERAQTILVNKFRNQWEVFWDWFLNKIHS